jgi:TM2 domain-containing membrane protein YozV
MAGLGSGGNVLAALCSFFIPGLGQLLQGRLGMAIVHFVLAGVLWFFLLGWLIHLWSIIEAARYIPCGATNQGTHPGAWDADAFPVA